MKLALDSNILLYAEGVNGAEEARRARALIGRLEELPVAVPLQAIGEVHRVLVRKARQSPAEAAAAAQVWLDLYEVIPTLETTFALAVEVAAAHHLQIWDAIILAAAAEADCRLLLSEDMQDGFTYAGVTVANPFAEPLNPLLAATLEAP